MTEFNMLSSYKRITRDFAISSVT